MTSDSTDPDWVGHGPNRPPHLTRGAVRTGVCCREIDVLTLCSAPNVLPYLCLERLGVCPPGGLTQRFADDILTRAVDVRHRRLVRGQERPVRVQQTDQHLGVLEQRFEPPPVPAALALALFPLGDIPPGRQHPHRFVVLVDWGHLCLDPDGLPLPRYHPERAVQCLARLEHRLQTPPGPVAVLGVDVPDELLDRGGVPADHLHEGVVPRDRVSLEVPLGDTGPGPREDEFESVALLCQFGAGPFAFDLVARPPPEQSDERLLGLRERLLARLLGGETQGPVQVLVRGDLPPDVRLQPERLVGPVPLPAGLGGVCECHQPLPVYRLPAVRLRQWARCSLLEQFVRPRRADDCLCPRSLPGVDARQEPVRQVEILPAGRQQPLYLLLERQRRVGRHLVDPLEDGHRRLLLPLAPLACGDVPLDTDEVGRSPLAVVDRRHREGHIAGPPVGSVRAELDRHRLPGVHRPTERRQRLRVWLRQRPRVTTERLPALVAGQLLEPLVDVHERGPLLSGVGDVDTDAGLVHRPFFQRQVTLLCQPLGLVTDRTDESPVTDAGQR